ncbi:MAG: dihydroorotate dehydrogenase-like protein [Vicinamibacterales bacterium]
MNLATTYLGLPLAHPLMTGASPLVDRLDLVKRLEDAGASAITMRSIFEEQIAMEQQATLRHMEQHAHAHAEALSYFPNADDYALGPDQYLEQIREIKAAVSIPVIASLNGTTGVGWVEYARLIEQANADALELNIYLLATDPAETGSAIEARIVEIVRAVRRAVRMPIAVKLSPFYSSLTNFATELDRAGADGLVLFNRFYQPDIDIEELEVQPKLLLSDSSELLLRVRWLAILAGHLRADLAVSGGVHTGVDAVKALMAGARGVQIVSAILHHGPERLTTMREELVRWMEDHEYESIEQLTGSMSLSRCPEPAAFERANYTRILQTWRV